MITPVPSTECSVRPLARRSDWRAFRRLPCELRSQQPGWVQPLKMMEGELLNRRRHPFYDGGKGAEAEFFLARNRQGQPIGRIGAIINHRYLADAENRDDHDGRPGFFGFFDCIDSPDVAGALLRAAKDWLGRRGCTELLGPASPSETYEYGLLVEGFDHPHRFFSAFQPAYYADLLTANGLTKAKDLLGLTLDTQDPNVVERVERFLDMAGPADDRLPGDITVRSPDLRKFDREVQVISRVFNEALGHLWGHCPISGGELADMAKSLKAVAPAEALLIAEKQGEAIGAVLTVPDLNEVIDRMRFHLGWLEPIELWCRTKLSRPTCVRTLVLGVKRGYERSMVVPVIVARLWRTLVRQRVRYIDAHLVLEDNSSIMTPLLRYGFQPNRRYRIYHSPI